MFSEESIIIECQLAKKPLACQMKQDWLATSDAFCYSVLPIICEQQDKPLNLAAT